MAAALGALVTVLENVEDFVSGDPEHRSFSGIKSFLESKGYVLVKTWRLMDCWTGGGSQRIRVFPVFEADKMASTLPAFVDCSGSTPDLLLILVRLCGVGLSNEDPRRICTRS